MKKGLLLQKPGKSKKNFNGLNQNLQIINMKKLLLTTIISALTVINVFGKSDTTIIEFNDKASKNRIKVITNNNTTIDMPRVLNLENVLKAIGVDSNERERALVLVTEGKDSKDTILVVSRDGQRIKIVTRDDIFDQKDSTLRNEKIESFEEIEITEKTKKVQPPKQKRFFAKSDFGFYIGLNNFLNGEPSIPNQQYKLRTLQSRYVALSFRKNATLIKGNKMDLAFSYGPEIAWYNLMLENSNVAIFENEQVSFMNNSKPTRKSKLVMPYLNLPILLNFGFKEDKFKIGIGGYIGYRIGGYTSERFVSGGKSRTKGSFGFTDIPYGLTTEFGKKNGLTLFARYDLNNLFVSNQVNAANLQAFSVGFRL
jgi:hypothetical protein